MTAGEPRERQELALMRERAVLLVVDHQERLAAAMPPDVVARAETNVCTLIAAAQRFGIPVVVSQQYPQGLGPTVRGVEEALAAGADVHRFDKVEFAACAAPGFVAVEQAISERPGPARTQWIVTGMETHVCVYQTVRQLVAAGRSVHVPQDAVVSRAKASWRVGLGLVERAGGVRTSTEVVVFDLLGRAGTEDFKALSRLVR